MLHEFDIKAYVIGRKRRRPDGHGQWRKVSKPVLDVVQAMADPHPAVLIMSYQTAKMGARWQHAPAKQRRMLRFRKEVKEKELLDDYPYERVVTVEKEITQFEEVLCCADCGLVLMDDEGPVRSLDALGKRKRWCQDCGSPLWQHVPFKYGGRIAMADFLNRHYSGRYQLILDEAHHTKGADTDVGYASADLVAGATKVIAMTGTLYSGKASSIFYLLYRLFPHFRQLYGYNEVQRFIEHHGLQETITRVKADDGYHSTYGYHRENVRMREIPGVSPGMVTMLLGQHGLLEVG